jgi:hypothetical protein
MRYARDGGPVKTENDPLDPNPVADMRETSAAMSDLDQAVTEAGGIALPYDNFYGAANDGWSNPCASGSSRSSATAGASPRSSTSTMPPQRPCSRSTTTAATPLSGLAHATVRGRSRRHARNRVPRSLEREGQARARLDAALSDLAAGFCRGLCQTERTDRHGGSNASVLTGEPEGVASRPRLSLGGGADVARGTAGIGELPCVVQGARRTGRASLLSLEPGVHGTLAEAPTTGSLNSTELHARPGVQEQRPARLRRPCLAGRHVRIRAAGARRTSGSDVPRRTRLRSAGSAHGSCSHRRA